MCRQWDKINALDLTWLGQSQIQMNVLISAYAPKVSRQSHSCLQEGEGSEPDVNPLALLPILADFVRLKDPGMLTLEVSGLVAKYPDIRWSDRPPWQL